MDLKDKKTIVNVIEDFSSFIDKFNAEFEGIIKIDVNEKSIYYIFPTYTNYISEKMDTLNLMRKFVAITNTFECKKNQQVNFDLFTNKIRELIKL